MVARSNSCDIGISDATLATARVPDLEFHPAASEFPLLDDERIAQLAEDMQLHGQREPIRVCGGQIVDGRNRYLACRHAGLEPLVESLPEDVDPFAYVWSLNGERRDLTQDQRYLIWKSCARKSGQWQARQRQLQKRANEARREAQRKRLGGKGQQPSTNCGRSSAAPRGRGSAERAAASHTNRGAVERMDRLERERPDLADAVRQGTLAPSEAMRRLTGPHVAHNAGENEWYTPAEYAAAARAVMGRIDLDPASTDAANRVIQARQFFSAEQDGLTRPWAGRVFMNPPYAQPLVQRFCGKLADHVDAGEVAQAIVLVNNATETRWFQRLLGTATAVCFPAGRVRFWHPERKSAPLQGQAIIYCGEQPEAFSRHFNPFGRTCHVVR